jgi:hypothetical protein
MCGSRVLPAQVDKYRGAGYPHSMIPASPPVADILRSGISERRFRSTRRAGTPQARKLAMTTRPDDTS